ncbi:tRNA (guanosine(18)-2'-O)-methyltransferase TrmH [Pleurocapsales cyanobacterium LEGE 06147]|nr:tRNA (guanosine(18)-2'-O)-methyltransferase TrmH [Pleurocapsales cyanobacterium LEGE 06147]
MIPKRYERLKQVLNRRQPDLTVLTEEVHKPHNFSAIMRTCDAVGVFAMHAVNSESQMPTYSQVSKGSEKWVYLNTHPDIKTAIAHLKQENFRIYAAHFSEEAVDYRTIDYTIPTAILLGSEKLGVSEQAATLADKHIIIPMLGMVKSLNVSVAAAVILFEAQSQRLKAGYYNRVRLDPKIYKRTIFEWSYPKIAAIYRQQAELYPHLGKEGEIIE